MENKRSEGGQSHRQRRCKRLCATRAVRFERAKLRAQCSGDLQQYEGVLIEDQGTRVGAHMKYNVWVLIL